jgi:type I restriction enzyme R subunit
MAGNDTEGLRYGTVGTDEKYYLTWKEEDPAYHPAIDPKEIRYLPQSDHEELESPLDVALTRLVCKERLIELVHDFIIFDRGWKKVPRHNQYFGVKAAQKRVQSREGGIIWHTQGSGKSLTMVWLAKWIREHVNDARVLIITDRTELDEQIEGVFKGVDEDIYRTSSGADLIQTLNTSEEWLICSLVHKFGRGFEGENPRAMDDYINEIRSSLPEGFSAKGELFVFVDECHRTQSGKLHKAMKAILPNAMFVGFTGTPLLKTDKQKSIEVFGPYIHTYKYDEAVADGVVLDLRYEARDIDQSISSQERVDQWFEARTQGLSEMAKMQLKQKWGTMQNVLSSLSRQRKIVADISMDMQLRPRLMNRSGNAMLVCDSIYQACKIYDLFQETDLKGKCAIVTSYKPSPGDIALENAGAGETEDIFKYEVYRRMLADFFEQPEETAIHRVVEFERLVKKRFVEEPGQMGLLIVVDKLLTGFDAPSATYLYIDKQMRDHGLFQAICRVNRLDGEDKEYGYIIDYKDLFHSLEGAITDYTSGALDGYDKEDVVGLLTNRLEKARERLEAARETVKALCEPVRMPRAQRDYFAYFSAVDGEDAETMRANEPKRVALYKTVAALTRAYANIANEMQEAGYSAQEIGQVKHEVTHYNHLENEIKLHSGDYLDMKMYEPAMRQLLDTYIEASASQRLADFEELGLVDLIVERGLSALDQLPEEIKADPEAVAETIDNNVRRVIIDERPVNPQYYDRMSALLEALILERRQKAIDYQAYLQRIKALIDMVEAPGSGAGVRYPTSIDTRAKQSLYDNLDQNEPAAVIVNEAVLSKKKDGWIGNIIKEREVKKAVYSALNEADVEIETEELDDLINIIKEQDAYQ